jgi:hypothetical protein
MDSKVAIDERKNFSQRLKESLLALDLTVKPSGFVRAFNARADGAAVTVHAARKWLVGEAIPTHEKVVILAIWLGVNPTWLRYGSRHPGKAEAEVIPEASVSTPALSLMNDIMSLPEPARRIIRDIVDSFLRNAPLSK